MMRHLQDRRMKIDACRHQSTLHGLFDITGEENTRAARAELENKRCIICRTKESFIDMPGRPENIQICILADLQRLTSDNVDDARPALSGTCERSFEPRHLPDMRPKDEHANVITLQDFREPRDVIKICMCQNQRIDGTMEERQSFPKPLEHRPIWSAIDKYDVPLLGRQEDAITLAHIQHVEYSGSSRPTTRLPPAEAYEYDEGQHGGKQADASHAAMLVCPAPSSQAFAHYPRGSWSATLGPMQALLILAGQSTRFWPLCEKSFFPLAGTCLVEEQMRRMRAAGISRITLVAGAHNAAEARARYPRLPILLQEDLSLGMRGALLSALPQLPDTPLLLVSANDLVETSAYTALLRAAKGRKEGGLLLARTVTSYFPGGYLSVRGARITDIVEKPGAGKEPSDLVNIVAHVHIQPSTLLSALKATTSAKDDGYEMALKKLLTSSRYDAVPYRGSWHPVKYPWHLLDVLPALLPHKGKPKIHRSARVHPSAVIEGPVVIGPGARVFAHASVIGPAFVGADAVIGNNALVRESSIGERAVVGYSTEICRSIVSADAWTHMNYVGDSILGERVSLGGGTMTGNLRLDETEVRSSVRGEVLGTGRTKCGTVIGAGCRLGVHTTIAPGVKIGADSFIASAASITADIPERSFVRPLPSECVDIRPNKAAPSPDRAELLKRVKKAR